MHKFDPLQVAEAKDMLDGAKLRLQTFIHRMEMQDNAWATKRIPQLQEVLRLCEQAYDLL